MKTTKTHIYFWGGVFSNFYPVKIKFNSLDFNSSEQLFMYLKATWFDDFEIAELILKAETPKEAKALGRKVKNFDEKTWDAYKYIAMYTACIHKFSQNEDLLKILLDETGDRVLVEASPVDRIWGVGLSEDNKLILNEENWLGQNLLGKVLMNVREELENGRELNVERNVDR